MERVTKAEREELLKARFILIPEKMARDAMRFKINIHDTVIEALRWRIRDKKEALLNWRLSEFRHVIECC
jgi:hypothetical protein